MGTRYKGTRAEVLALDAFIKLTRAADSVTGRVEKHLVRHSLTPSQFGTLEMLYHLGPLCQRDIAAKLLRSSGNITMVIDNLEKRGLVLRERNESDRRLVTVSLTEEGRRLIAAIMPDHVAAIVEAMSALTAEEQTQLGALCKKLGLHASE